MTRCRTTGQPPESRIEPIRVVRRLQSDGRALPHPDSRRRREVATDWYHRFVRIGKGIVPKDYWPRVAARVYPLLKPGRRQARIEFVQVPGGLWQARFLDTEQAIYFYEPRRAERLVWPGGPKDAVRKTMKRYLDSRCRVEPGDIVVDIGANIGEFSILASETASRVIAIEGDPTPFACLTRNAEQFGRIDAVHAVVGDRDGKETFYLAPSGADSSLVMPQVRSDWHVVEVRQIDSVLSAMGVSRIDFLKMDAEGAEPEVLAGAQRTLGQCRAVVVDAGPERRGRPTREAVEAILKDAGFRTWNRSTVLFGTRGPESHDPD